jgi:hypothetical protein
MCTILFMLPSPEAHQVASLFRRHGVTGEIREAEAATDDERVFVLTTEQAAKVDEASLTKALTELLRCKVWVVTEGPAWTGQTKPLWITVDVGIADAATFFRDKGLELRTWQENRFFGKRLWWADLVRGASGEVLWPRYGRGSSEAEAILSARRRYRDEEGE